jgi:putative spermidine/putrescine transport system ATP-binding protein
VFASDFIGDTNLVRGTVVASDGRRVELVTLGGATVSGEASEAIAVGRPVTLSVRPASVRVSRAETDAALDGTSGLAAVIAELIYLGDRIRVEADAGAGLVVSADLREAEADGLERTMPVRLEWAPNAASVWADRTDDTGQEER